MSYLLIGLAVLAVFWIYRQQGSGNSISAREAHALQTDTTVVFLDVRTRGEWDQFHISKAIHIPLDELDQRKNELKKYEGKKLIVYCRSGNRSATATRLLTSAGFNAVNMAGGIIAWPR
ncbi:MAG: rhodanese-like domain-containing protein [Bacteroidetes bacterium]|nr:rhodanese-like domain-containing protein [Bacteroidota bacterium]